MNYIDQFTKDDAFVTGYNAIHLITELHNHINIQALKVFVKNINDREVIAGFKNLTVVDIGEYDKNKVLIIRMPNENDDLVTFYMRDEDMTIERRDSTNGDLYALIPCVPYRYLTPNVMNLLAYVLSIKTEYMRIFNSKANSDDTVGLSQNDALSLITNN